MLIVASQPSYAQDLGVGVVEHGLYGSLLNALGGAIGCLGAFPCLPCPNPFREVNQGEDDSSFRRTAF